MKEKLIAWMKRSSLNMHYLRLLAGAYVLYLGWMNVKGYVNGETDDTTMVIFSGILGLCGLLIMAISIYALRKHLGYDPHAPKTEEEEYETVSEETEETGSALPAAEEDIPSEDENEP